MAYLELASPKKQRTWGWPAVVNLALGGSGAGLYLLGTFFSMLDQAWPVQTQLIAYQILAPAIVCLGFIALPIEAGKPLRAYRLFGNLTGSWMAVESLAGASFIVTAVISRFSAASIFDTLAVVAALLLILSQGMMVFRATAVKAWNQKLTPLLFVTSGLMTACGFFLLNMRGQLGLAKPLMTVFLFIIVLNLIFWLLYLFGKRDQDFKAGVKFLRRPLLLTAIAVFGHLVPAVHLFLIASTEMVLLSSAVLGSITGLVLVGCGSAQKAGIIMAAGSFRSLVLHADQGL